MDWQGIAYRQQAARRYVASLSTPELSALIERLRYRDWTQSEPYAITGADATQRRDLWDAIGAELRKRADQDVLAQWKRLSVSYPNGQVKPRSPIPGPPPDTPVWKTDRTKPETSMEVAPERPNPKRIKHVYRKRWIGLSDQERWQTAILDYLDTHVNDNPTNEIRQRDLTQALNFKKYPAAEPVLQDLKDRKIIGHRREGKTTWLRILVFPDELDPRSHKTAADMPRKGNRSREPGDWWLANREALIALRKQGKKGGLNGKNGGQSDLVESYWAAKKTRLEHEEATYLRAIIEAGLPLADDDTDAESESAGYALPWQSTVDLSDGKLTVPEAEEEPEDRFGSMADRYLENIRRAQRR
jgi:hypothetical protein